MRKSASLRCRAYQRKKKRENQTRTIRALAGIAIVLATLVTCNVPKKTESHKGNEYTTVGIFNGVTTEPYGNKYYHFKSNDNAMWWCLTQSQIDFVPKVNKEYILVYNDKGTVTDTYDDELVTITERR